MFPASPMTGDTQIFSVKIDNQFSDFGQVKIDPTRSFLQTLGRAQLFYWVWARQAAKSNPIPLCLTKNSRTKHKIWRESFSMIQSTGIKSRTRFLTSKVKSVIFFCNTFF